MRIIGPPSASQGTVMQNIPLSAHARFRTDMLLELWNAARHYNIDPVGVVAQAAKETNWGNYTGNVKPEFFNTCGLKVRYQNLFNETAGDNPLAHQMFPNWQVGAIAHVQHLRAYAGWSVDDVIVDPRYVYVSGKYTCEDFKDLGGKWAPATDYGIKLVELAKQLQGVA